MKFVCLVYFEPQAFAALSPGEKAAIGRDSMAYDKELDRTGHYVIAEALDPVSTARTVQVRHGKAKVVDGPFAETKEHLGGVHPRRCSEHGRGARYRYENSLGEIGSIEVRPVMIFGGKP